MRLAEIETQLEKASIAPDTSWAASNITEKESTQHVHDGVAQARKILATQTFAELDKLLKSGSIHIYTRMRQRPRYHGERAARKIVDHALCDRALYFCRRRQEACTI